MTQGRFARQWWVGGQLVGVLIPLIFGVVALGSDQPFWGVIAGIGAVVGIWFSDDALVKAGQAVPLS